MTRIGTPLSPTATRVLLCGGGELGKEVVIELQRLGVEVIVVDRYDNAPAMQVAHRSHAISMLDGEALRAVIEREKPDYIVPEIEAIATDTLVELESEGYTVIPTARAARLTMNREGIRRLAAEELGLPTSSYRFAATHEEFDAAVAEIGIPCVVKPIMSSSGKGQSTIREAADIETAWAYAQEGGRTGAGKVIIEGFVDFDYEITQLTVRHAGGTRFLEPVGHVQVDLEMAAEGGLDQVHLAGRRRDVPVGSGRSVDHLDERGQAGAQGHGNPGDDGVGLDQIDECLPGGDGEYVIEFTRSGRAIVSRRTSGK